MAAHVREVRGQLDDIAASLTGQEGSPYAEF
jgi:hypothetical protein